MLRRGFLSGASVLALTHRALAQPSSRALGSVGGPPPAGYLSGLGPQTLGNGPSLDLNFLSGTLDPRITFTRASAASYFDVAGALQSATTNTPRIDYDPVTHACRGLLIEESRTNLLLNSATLATQSVTTTATAYTLSFYGTGTVTLSGTSTAGPLVGTGAFPARVTQTFTPTAGTLTLTATGSVLNANLEAGAFATSVIQTTGTAITRAADVATTPLPAGFNPALNSWAAEFVMAAMPQYFPQILGASASDHGMLYTNGGSAAALYDTVAVVSTGNFVTANVIAKAASSLSSGIGSVCLNGGTVATAGGFTNGFPISAIRLMGDGPSPASQANGWLRRARYWPRALAGFELQQAAT